MTILLSGITQPSFFASTKKALDASHGSNVSDKIVRKFIKNQFHLENEHLIPSLFSTSATSEPLSPEQLVDVIESELNEINFLGDWGNGSELRIERSFEVAVSNVDGDDHSLDFNLVVDLECIEDKSQEFTYLIFGKNFGEGMHDPEYIYIKDIPGIISGDENITLPEHVNYDELRSAGSMLMRIYNLFSMHPVISLVTNKQNVTVATNETSEPKPSVVDVTVVFTQDGEHIHSWETDIGNLEITSLMEAACNTGLVDDSMELDYIVYDDKEVDAVLLEGSIKPWLLNLS